MVSLTVRPGVEAVVQGRVELRHVAHGHRGSDGGDALLLRGERLAGRHRRVLGSAAAAEANGGARPSAIVAIKAQAKGLVRLACVVLLIAHLLHPGHVPAVRPCPVTARCVMAVVGAAPCQCLTPGGHETTSPGRITCIGLPHSCVRPTPEINDQALPARMRMPSRTRAGLERHQRARGVDVGVGGPDGIDAHPSGEELGRPCARPALRHERSPARRRVPSAHRPRRRRRCTGSSRGRRKRPRSNVCCSSRILRNTFEDEGLSTR